MLSPPISLRPLRLALVLSASGLLAATTVSGAGEPAGEVLTPDAAFYVAPDSSPARQAAAWAHRPDDATAAGLRRGPAVVMVEPDALPQLPQMAEAGQALRVELLRHAVTTLAARPHTAVYLDAGNSGWLDAATAARMSLRS